MYLISFLSQLIPTIANHLMLRKALTVGKYSFYTFTAKNARPVKLLILNWHSIGQIWSSPSSTGSELYIYLLPYAPQLHGK